MQSHELQPIRHGRDQSRITAPEARRGVREAIHGRHAQMVTAEAAIATAVCSNVGRLSIGIDGQEVIDLDQRIKVYSGVKEAVVAMQRALGIG